MDSTATTTPTAGTIRSHRLAACLQPPGQRLRIEAIAHGDAARPELECYVGAAFQTRHGAVVRSFMPTLLAFRDRSGALRGVAGVRGAHEERLYLEQYLARPIEQALAAALEAQGVTRIPRQEIAEVGNLAGASCRAAVRMVAHIPAWLMSQRYAWIVFTATDALRQILAGLDAPLLELARADRASVATSRDDWGRYYETDPRVYAGRLRDAERLAGFAHLGDR
ncbi:MAG TPA: thermostable hemolysin [Steroidobacteraceae bacterium]|nr:thermostable hemolysin [Steroidobacteraceae bacterium]